MKEYEVVCAFATNWIKFKIKSLKWPYEILSCSRKFKNIFPLLYRAYLIMTIIHVSTFDDRCVDIEWLYVSISMYFNKSRNSSIHDF